MPVTNEFQELDDKVSDLGLANIRYHIFLCCHQTKPKCCSHEIGAQSWQFLKQRLKELGLTAKGKVFRTRADCLRVCIKGPIAVVYPQGIWYHSCAPEVLEKIIQEHFIQHQPVEDYIFYRADAVESISRD